MRIPKPPPPGRKASAPLPNKEEVRRFITESTGRISKREIARAFGITGDQRSQLRNILRELREEGVFNSKHGISLKADCGNKPGSSHSKYNTATRALPNVCVVEVQRIDSDGELRARPIKIEDGYGMIPTIYIDPQTPSQGALGVGDRVLARLTVTDDGSYQASAIRVLDGGAGRLIGRFVATHNAKGDASGGKIELADRRSRNDYLVAPEHCADAASGELVLAEIVPGRTLGLPCARVTERLGDLNAPNAISLLAIHANLIPTAFSDASLAQAEAAGPVTLGKRTDLRSLPLVTIDGVDARDFDDAVWAEADSDPKNPGGWHILIAIADVAHYVRHSDALDEDARERGNSVYFPDRVVPMLPEVLSNGLCSLRPDEDRACLAVHIYLSAEGEIRRHHFVRGLMRSAARLNYGQFQKALDGNPDEALKPLMATVVAPLFSAYSALAAARQKRGTLELILPEREVKLAPDGSVERISEAPRYESHKLIEEFMIAANVAAAEALEAKKSACVYRVHDQPDPAKLEGLREFLTGLGLKLSRNRKLNASNINQILTKAADSPNQHLVNLLVLRSQARAEYLPNNFGHFGLGLKRYAHFTSPIRRYADLLVHRSLVAAYGLGDGGLPKNSAAAFSEICTHISQTERRAVTAERDAKDRYTAAYLTAQVGADFAARISGVARFGLFIELDETGADGLIPARSLSAARPRFDPRCHTLSVGTTHLTIGERVVVRLAEANALTGGMIFDLLEVNGKTWRQPRQSDKTRPSGRATKRGKRSKRNKRK